MFYVELNIAELGKQLYKCAHCFHFQCAQNYYNNLNVVESFAGSDAIHDASITLLCVDEIFFDFGPAILVNVVVLMRVNRLRWLTLFVR